MASTRDYISPDGSLRLLVVTEDDGDVALGFDGFAWHTHADILAAEAGIPQKEAVEEFVQAVLSNRAILAVSRIEGKVHDVWVTDDPASECHYLSEGESLELRYWDGRPWSGAESATAAVPPRD